MAVSDEDQAVLELDLLVTDLVLARADLPQPGDDVPGIMLLQGTVWMPDVA